MDTLYNQQSREQLKERISKLRADMQPLFGSMSPRRAVTHLIDQLRVARGEKQAPDGEPGFLMKCVMRPLFIHCLPWPKGKLKTAPVLLETEPGDFMEDCGQLKLLIDEFPEKVYAGSRARHPALGELCGREWGILSYRHIDHHLSQYGV